MVSTFSALLEVEIDLGRRTVKCRVADEGRGIYSGMTGCDGRVLVVTRSLDAQPAPPGVAANAIYSFDPGRSDPMALQAADASFKDLHQIRAMGRWLCVLLNHGSRIAIFDRRTWRQTAEIALEPFIPRRLRAPDHGSGGDAYHFNSLTFRDGRAFVLAHNWHRGSFALELDYALGQDGPVFTRLAAVHKDLGQAAHDAAFHDGTLHVLDSNNNALLLRGGNSRRMLLKGGEMTGHGFPRGLALSGDHIVIGMGSWSAERAARMMGETRLQVIQRSTGAVALDAMLGHYGNSSDVLLLSPPDLSDEPGALPAARSAWKLSRPWLKPLRHAPWNPVWPGVHKSGPI